MQFHKYHGLGNDYLVMDPATVGRELTAAEIELICHRNYGIGSDGILWGPMLSERADFRLRIFNPDASEAEKSGNGLRIFARYLYDRGLVGESPFTIETLGGVVRAMVRPGGGAVRVDMGHVSFHSTKIPVVGEPREVLNEEAIWDGQLFRFCCATIGNPHCVLPLPVVSAEQARRLGPLIEHDARFPHRTNVQFLQVLDRQNIRIEIWERGAGYTLASGSSSSAAAAVAKRLGLVDQAVTVHMPGGTLQLHLSDDYFVEMEGAVASVGTGTIAPEAFTVTPVQA